MSDELRHLFAGGLGSAMVMMHAVWVLARCINNAGIVDIGWAGFGS